jgi:hypothetical protein
MKKIFGLTLFVIIFLPILTQANEPARLDKCCQRTGTNLSTQCRYGQSHCGKPKNDTTNYVEYTIIDNATCIKKVGGQNPSKFEDGQCVASGKESVALNDLETVSKMAGYDAKQNDPQAIALFVGKIIKIALGLTGMIFLIFAVYSGVQWMTAGGNAERVSEARSRLIETAIGMMITSIAYAAASFIINVIASAS